MEPLPDENQQLGGVEQGPTPVEGTLDGADGEAVWLHHGHFENEVCPCSLGCPWIAASKD